MRLENYYKRLEADSLCTIKLFFVRTPDAKNNFILIRSSLTGKDLGIITLLNDGEYDKDMGFFKSGKETCTFKILTPGTKIKTSFEVELVEINRLFLFLYIRDSFGMEYNSELDCLEKVVYLSNIEVLPLDKFLGVTPDFIKVSNSRIELFYSYAVGILSKYGYDKKYNQTKPVDYYISISGSHFGVAIPWSSEVLGYFLDDYKGSAGQDINTGAGDFDKKTIVRKTRM